MALGCTIVFAEGAPDWPAADRLWGLVESERVTILGLSPTLVRALIPHGAELVERHDLSSLRVLVHDRRAVEPGAVPLALSSTSAAAAARSSTAPAAPRSAPASSRPRLRRRSSRARSAARRSGWRWTSSTRRAARCAARSASSSAGRPCPGMTRGFWRDRERYLDTYWRRLPGIWVHGDWASVDEDGYWFLHGRSDDTLNIAGKRHRAGRARVGRGRAPVGRRGRGGRRAARGEGRGGVDLLRARARRRAERRARGRAARAARPTRSARRSRRARRCSSRRCRRRAARRSSGARCARRRSARIPATSRRWRTPRHWRRSSMSQPADRLDGQVALVTGGGRGIGAGHRARARRRGRARRRRGSHARAGRGGRRARSAACRSRST